MRPSELREWFLAKQTNDPALGSEYERKLNSMYEIQLSVSKKLWFVALAGFCLVIGTVAVALALTETLPPALRTLLLVGAAFAAAWLAFFIRMLRRGALLRRVDPPMAAGMAFVFSMIMSMLLAIGGLPVERVILVAVLILFPAGLLVLRTVAEQSEMQTQQRENRRWRHLRTTTKIENSTLL
jgi:hypothetical protein